MFAVVTEFDEALRDFKAFERADDARRFLKARLEALETRVLIGGDFVKGATALGVATTDAREAKRLVEARKAAVLVDSADADSVMEPYDAF
jgi:hypothetical protein